MTNKVECRLPSITSLSLDFPVSAPQPQPQDHSARFPAYSNPQTAPYTPYALQSAVLSRPELGHAAPHVPMATPQNSFFVYSAVSPALGSHEFPHPGSASHATSGSVGFHVSSPAVGQGSFAASVHSAPKYHVVSPQNRSSAESALLTKPHPHPQQASSTSPSQGTNYALLQQPSPSSSRRSSALSPLGDRKIQVATPNVSTPSDSESVYHTAEASRSPDGNKDLKRRKKRQCPECHLFFSNLATHKSTHLNPTSRPHVCKVCHRGFARPNDLFRHFKCHWKETGADNGQYKCPFKNGTDSDHCCHTSGIFSRCDTYKNHLRAIHFQYPKGTKKNQRGSIPGCCRLCQKEFSNVDEWINTHVDSHQCAYISHSAL